MMTVYRTMWRMPTRFDLTEKDVGAKIRNGADFTLSHAGQAIRRNTGMPRPVMMLIILQATLQATLAPVFCVSRVRAWRPISTL
jgi:hypothetical protein